MLNRMWPLILGSLVCANSYAASICTKLDECELLRTEVEAKIHELQAALAPKLTDYARTEHGRVKPMPQFEARGHSLKLQLPR